MEKIILDNKTIFITGAAGFIGSNLVKRLFSDVKGATIVGVDNMNAYYDVALKEYRLAQLKDESVKCNVDWHFIKGTLPTIALTCLCHSEDQKRNNLTGKTLRTAIGQR